MGGNPWRKWLGESDDPGRNRLQAFVYSRLWMGVFPSFLAGFAVTGGICLSRSRLTRLCSPDCYAWWVMR
mgnify:CR=1 FL=1